MELQSTAQSPTGKMSRKVKLTVAQFFTQIS